MIFPNGPGSAGTTSAWRRRWLPRGTCRGACGDRWRHSASRGEKLDAGQVRSSVARRLGIDIGGLKPADRHVEGVVEMMLDATQRYDQPLTQERLSGWHASLFPTPAWMHPIEVGQRLVINRLLEGFEGKLTTSKWATLTKSSQDTALRDIQQLVERGLLMRNAAGGRSTSYSLALLQT